MSVSSELDRLVTMITNEINKDIDKSIEWTLDGHEYVDKLDGDDYNNVINNLKKLVIEKLWEEQKTY